MMVKKLVKMVFAGVLALSLSLPVFAGAAPAEGDEIHVISLDEAVNIALSHSSTIGELEDTLDTLEDSREALNNAYMSWAKMQADAPTYVSDQYHSFLQSFTELDTGIKNISLYNKLTEQGLRYGLMNLARYIK